MPVLAAMTAEGVWRPGIGDPTVMGWVIVAAYFAAALACARATLVARDDAAFWGLFSGGLLILGINKQLDLQSYLTVVGRRLAQEQGWYPHRHAVQKAFIAAVGASALAALVALCWLARRSWRRRLPAIAGGALLAAFVLIRASSFHHVDRLIGQGIVGLKWNWIVELGGIAVVGMAAMRAIRGEGGRAEDTIWFPRL